MTTAVIGIILGMFGWFVWAILGIRRIYYRMFQKQKINQILQLLYEEGDNPNFKNSKVEKYIKLGFYNPVLFEIAEKIYYKRTQKIIKLNVKEKNNGHAKRFAEPIRETESFESEDSENPEFEPAGNQADTIAGNSGDARTRELRKPARPIETRRTDSNSARVNSNSQVARQRDLSIGNSEKPAKKSRYFD